MYQTVDSNHPFLNVPCERNLSSVGLLGAKGKLVIPECLIVGREMKLKPSFQPVIVHFAIENKNCDLRCDGGMLEWFARRTSRTSKFVRIFCARMFCDCGAWCRLLSGIMTSRYWKTGDNRNEKALIRRVSRYKTTRIYYDRKRGGQRKADGIFNPGRQRCPVMRVYRAEYWALVSQSHEANYLLSQPPSTPTLHRHGQHTRFTLRNEARHQAPT